MGDDWLWCGGLCFAQVAIRIFAILNRLCTGANARAIVTAIDGDVTGWLDDFCPPTDRSSANCWQFNLGSLSIFETQVDTTHGRLINETCPKCKTENSLNFSIYREYVHLTLVPLFPFGKKVFINCNHCDENFDYPDLNESSQQKLANEKLAFPRIKSRNLVF